MADSSFDDSLITLKYGAGIIKREIICAGVSNSAAPYRTGLIAGDTELIARITDSRGFTAQQKISIKPEAYAKPRLSGIEIFRSDAAGTADEAGGRICARATAMVSSLAGENTLSLTAAIRSKYGSYGGEQSLASGEAAVLSDSASPDETIFVRLTARDRLGETAQYEHTLSPRRWAMKFRESGEGVAFGKAPSVDKVLEIPEDWEIKRGQKLLPWGIAPGTVTRNMLAEEVTAGALGGATVSLLWENPSLLAAFPAQNIYLPGNERKLYLLYTIASIEDPSLMSFICPNVVTTTSKLSFPWAYHDLVVSNRSLYVGQNSTISISQNTYMTHTGYSGVNDQFNIPWRIYGINF